MIENKHAQTERVNNFSIDFASHPSARLCPSHRNVRRSIEGTISCVHLINLSPCVDFSQPLVTQPFHISGVCVQCAWLSRCNAEATIDFNSLIQRKCQLSQLTTAWTPPIWYVFNNIVHCHRVLVAQEKHVSSGFSPTEPYARAVDAVVGVDSMDYYLPLLSRDERMRTRCQPQRFRDIRNSVIGIIGHISIYQVVERCASSTFDFCQTKF